MEFHVIQRGGWPPQSGHSSVYLRIDFWNDYSFQTLFQLYFIDDVGRLHELGDVKIGFKGQGIETATYTTLEKTFSTLDSRYYSLGQSIDFYRKMSALPSSVRQSILSGLRDIVYHPALIEEVEGEKSFSVSLLRDLSLSTVRGQFARVLEGGAPLTNFDFIFKREESADFGGISLEFKVVAEATPSTNIHAVIGRNGVGKTTLFNDMVEAITKNSHRASFRSKVNSPFPPHSYGPISSDYFSSLVSVAFSAFDPFVPPQDQPDPAKGACYFYIGLKDSKNPGRLRSLSDLQEDAVNALIKCFFKDDSTRRWRRAIEELGSDDNFLSMRLDRLLDDYLELRKMNDSGQADSKEFKDIYLEKCRPFLNKMSSGHAIVFLTITRLVAIVEEKTLILLDEPESHLHPPLLAAFVRALAELLHDRNGVALIATHSPVVLQEVPKSCVWKLYRTGKDISAERPNIETFGESIGVLTSEVFRLEVSRSGFHKMLTRSVESGLTYSEILESYNYQLGIEGRTVLKLLIAVERGHLQ